MVRFAERHHGFGPGFQYRDADGGDYETANNEIRLTIRRLPGSLGFEAQRAAYCS